MSQSCGQKESEPESKKNQKKMKASCFPDNTEMKTPRQRARIIWQKNVAEMWHFVFEKAGFGKNRKEWQKKSET